MVVMGLGGSKGGGGGGVHLGCSGRFHPPCLFLSLILIEKIWFIQVFHLSVPSQKSG